MDRMDLHGIGMTSRRTRERLVQRLLDQGINDSVVLDVMRTTPRHLFLDEAMAHRAYEDVALPIGHQQTLSQPYVVARMTELLMASGPRQRVLEIGTGSGYQTAVLAQLVGEVYSVERIKPLQQKARQRLRQLRLRNVLFEHADGCMGWPEYGPYDGIVVTAAPQRIPEELLSQLAVGGRMVLPVGGDTQDLHLVTRSSSGYETEVVESVYFVPLLPGKER
ncbi:protein-L-isoaspartate(D-aspartate) O-methyltransferase [Halieaceae bacterium IMCC11814]|uniref:Protein-L-isoaspartate O-methyltransferase n=2 Tax=Candidatus Marimicrobium litorale TaxID=2518991 RepID=A0ABT3T0R5_9GAMM|nr:protein-L-isoaspartate(D-aspartate) O-methyltransferase [Candidatus Marimicrobium litorale]